MTVVKATQHAMVARRLVVPHVPRIALISEDAYPYGGGEVGAWCAGLVSRLPDTRFHVVSITGTHRAPGRGTLPANAVSLTTVPIWPAGMAKPMSGVPVSGAAGSTRVGGRGGPDDGTATRAAVLLCRGMFGDTTYHHAMFRTGLRGLAEGAGGQPPQAAPIAGVPLAEVLADGWAAGNPDHRFTATEAHAAAGALASALRPLAVAPRVDLRHAVDSGLSGLVALAARWRHGTPYLLTEHTLYARERGVELARDVPAATRVTLVRLFGALARVLYSQAALVAAVVPGFQRWQVDHGAAPERLLTIPADASPETYQRLYRDILSDQPTDQRTEPDRRAGSPRPTGRVHPPDHLVWPPLSPALRHPGRWTAGRHPAA